MKAQIEVLSGNSYVWDADVAHWLRLECGLVGASIGGVAAFKQQNAVHGLPLELSPEEVTLALERGWGELAPALGTAAAAAAAAAGAASRKRARQASAWQYYEEEEEELGDREAMDAEENGREQQQQEEPAEPTWRAALADGAPFAIPTTPAEAAAVNAGRSPEEAAAAAAAAATAGQAAAGEPGGEAAAAAAGGGQAVPEWTFPATQEERHRYWVFRDLHAKGYRLTGGSKFGADFLVYPGDPTLYHAQFCVRLLPYRQPILPAMLASATRGSHQARKHLLIASVVEDAEEAAREAGGAAEGAAAGAAAPADGREQQQQGGQQQQPQQQEEQPVQPPEGAGGAQLGANSRGTGSRGERFRIRYMTIGPVEGFG
ncbi:hypothetical protein ABPG75_003342 [Micractinium tetrahymenae]